MKLRAWPERSSRSPSGVRPPEMLLSSLGMMTGKAAAMGLGFLFWLLAARMFPPYDVGITAGAISAIMLCVLLASAGMGPAFVLLFPRHRNVSRLLDTAISTTALSGGLCALLFLLFASGVFKELQIIARIPSYSLLFLLMGVLGTVLLMLEQVSMAQRRGHDVLVRDALNGLVTILPVPIVYMLVPEAGSLALFACWVGGVAGASVVAWVQLSRTTPDYRFAPRMRRSEVAELVRVGLPNQALTLAERAPGLILLVVVVELVSAEINAYWYSIWMMAWAVAVVPVALGIALFAEASHRPQSFHHEARRSIRSSLLLAGSAAAFLIVFADPILGLLGGRYAEVGVLPLRILVLAALPAAFIQAYYTACRSGGQIGEAVIAGTVGGVVGVVATAFAAVWYGLVGMATAWVLTQTCLGTWAAWRLHRFRFSSEPQPLPTHPGRRPDITRASSRAEVAEPVGGVAARGSAARRSW